MLKKLAILVGIALTSIFSSPAWAEENTKEADQAIVQQAMNLLQAHQPKQATEVLAPLLSRLDTLITATRKNSLVFCRPTMAETILYSAMSAKQKKNSVVFGPELCQAYFYNSYALMEIGEKADALRALQRLTELAPMHAQYFVELGYAYRVNGRNTEAMAAYKSALEKANFAGRDDEQKFFRAAAQRGIGYMLIEEGDLDGAERAYKASLKDDPTSPIAKSELKFIAAQRQK